MISYNQVVSHSEILVQAEKKIISLYLQLEEKDQTIEEARRSSEEKFREEKLILENNLDRLEASNREILATLAEADMKLNVEKEKNSFYEQEIYSMRFDFKQMKEELAATKLELLDVLRSSNILKRSLDAANAQIEILTATKTKCIEEEQRRQTLEIDLALKESQLKDIRNKLAEVRQESFDLKVANNDHVTHLKASFDKKVVSANLTEESLRAKSEISHLIELLRDAQRHHSQLQSTPLIIHTSTIQTQTETELTGDSKTTTHTHNSSSSSRSLSRTFSASDSNTFHNHYEHHLPSGSSNNQTTNEHVQNNNGSHNASHNALRLPRPPSLIKTTSSERIYVAPKIKDPDQEALATGILLSQQEAEYGVNMFDSLSAEDESAVRQHTTEGFTWEEAVFLVFRDKFVLPEKAASSARRKQGGDVPLHTMMSLVRLTVVPLRNA